MKIVKAIEKLNLWMSYVSMAMIVFMMLFITADVIFRVVFNSPIMGSTEISRMLMVGLILLFGRCALEKQHLRVDIVTNRLPLKMQAVLEIITLLISLAVIAFLAWQSYESAIYMKRFNLSFSLLKVPHYPFLLFVTFSFVVLCITIIALIAHNVSKVTKHES